MFADGLMESSSTKGTADYVLTGAVYNGFTFGTVFTNTKPVAFIAQTLTRTKFEIVVGEYRIGPPKKLLRTTVLMSSQGGAKIDWQEDDDYYIASFASATVMGGLIKGNQADSRPWWVQFARWIKSNFPTAGLNTEYFFDGTNDIPLGKINPTAHTYESVFCPPGAIFEYAGTVAPAGFLLCQGQSLLRASYPALFTAIGTKFGAADGTHFNLPDRRGRYGVGVDAASAHISNFDATDVGKTGGDEDAAAPMSGGTIAGTVTGTTGTNTPLQAGAGSGGGSSFFYTGDHTHPITAQPVSITGNSGDFSILPPSIAMNYIISTGGV